MAEADLTLLVMLEERLCVDSNLLALVYAFSAQELLCARTDPAFVGRNMMVL
jgi:hypothetical protein